jgi:hypothetical protein
MRLEHNLKHLYCTANEDPTLSLEKKKNQHAWNPEALISQAVLDSWSINFTNSLHKCTEKKVPVHNLAPHHEGRWRRKCVSPCILNLSSKYRHMISFIPWPLYIQRKRLPGYTKHRRGLTLEIVWMLWRREDCWELAPDFVIQPIPQSLHLPSIQTQIIYVRVNNKLTSQVMGTKVYQ